MADLPPTLWTRDDAELDDLADAYFAHIAEEDLAKLDQEQRRRQLEAHVSLAGSRTDSDPAVAVNTLGRRSVVQVVTDDMPYLVDSVTAEITRCGHAISL